MDSFIIRGPQRLKGTVEVSGAKNAVLPLLAASILSSGKSAFENVPNLRDTRTMSKLIEIMGGRVSLSGGRLEVDTSSINSFEAPYELVRTMRASFYVLGPLLARYGKARVSMPGGCAWGPRPVDLHIQGMIKLGADITIEHGYVNASAEEGLRGAEIILPVPSVGATINIAMAAVLAEGTTVIDNAAREPEVETTLKVLKKGGARIEGEGTSLIKVEGVKEISPCEFDVIPDRIEAGTFATAAVATGGEVRIDKCNPGHLHALIDELENCGAEVDRGKDYMVVKGPEVINSLNVETGFYPSFPTDMQAQIMAVLCRGRGSSTIVEQVYPDRFTHVPELRRMGARINLDGRVAVVEGVDNFQGAPVMATDIRASSALVIAGLAAQGETKILRVYHIDRGYERLEEKLRGLGADIERVHE
jgi:UDP-N-acetylglucosamine 1-carboxyvinyltransferase